MDLFDSLFSENSVCPACNSDLTLAQMFSDIIAQREILMLKIHCTNQGCSEVIDLGALEVSLLIHPWIFYFLFFFLFFFMFFSL